MTTPIGTGTSIPGIETESYAPDPNRLAHLQQKAEAAGFKPDMDGGGSTSMYIVQDALNQACDAQLELDGHLTPATSRALVTFLQTASPDDRKVFMQRVGEPIASQIDALTTPSQDEVDHASVSAWEHKDEAPANLPTTRLQASFGVSALAFPYSDGLQMNRLQQIEAQCQELASMQGAPKAAIDKQTAHVRDLVQGLDETKTPGLRASLNSALDILQVEVTQGDMADEVRHTLDSIQQQLDTVAEKVQPIKAESNPNALTPMQTMALTSALQQIDQLSHLVDHHPSAIQQITPIVQHAANSLIGTNFAEVGFQLNNQCITAMATSIMPLVNGFFMRQQLDEIRKTLTTVLHPPLTSDQTTMVANLETQIKDTMADGPVTPKQADKLATDVLHAAVVLQAQGRTEDGERLMTLCENVQQAARHGTPAEVQQHVERLQTAVSSLMYHNTTLP